MTAKQVPSNQEVVSHLLSRFRFATYSDLQAALAVLTRCVLSSMQAPACYALPLDQKLPDEMGPEGSFTTVHPQNVATALVSIALSGQRLGGDALSMDPSLQLWIGDWTLFGELAWQPVPILVEAAAAPPPAPAVPPAPAIPPAPVSNSVMDLVNAALADSPVAAVVEDPAVVATPAPPAAPKGPPKPPAKAQVPVAPTTVPATPTVATAPPPPRIPQPPTKALKPSPPKVVPQGDTELPDPSVILQRTGSSGRPQASPFTKKVEPRTKVGEPPFWWSFFLHAAERILTQHPAQALDPDSQGSGPVQAYSLLLHILHDKVLSGVDGYQTVAALRTYLKEVIANIDALPACDAINQLADNMLGEVEQEEKEEETE